MFCVKCGAENANGAKFCISCGAPMESGKAPAVDVAAGVKKVKSLPKAVLIGVPTAIIALIVFICVMVKIGNTINLNDYVVVEFSGYDGYGHAEARIDWEAIEKKYGKKIKFTSYAKKEFGEWISFITPMEVLSDSIDVELDKYKELANADTVTYTFKLYEDEEGALAKYFNIKLKYKEGNKTVEGLKDVEKFDAFSKLEVKFTGVAPFAGVEYSYKGSELSENAFRCDKYGYWNLTTGDKIKFTIDEGYIISCIEKYGLAPKETEKEYTVSGLNEYVTKVSQLDDTIKNTLKAKLEEYYNGKSFYEDEKLVAFEYVGDVVLSPKTDLSWRYTPSNYVFLVYKVTIRNHYKNYDQENTFYWYGRFEDVEIKADGTIECMKLDEWSQVGDDWSQVGNRVTIHSGEYSWFWEQTWSYYGYESVDDMYEKIVNENPDYSIDTNIK